MQFINLFGNLDTWLLFLLNQFLMSYFVQNNHFLVSFLEEVDFGLVWDGWLVNLEDWLWWVSNIIPSNWAMFLLRRGNVIHRSIWAFMIAAMMWHSTKALLILQLPRTIFIKHWYCPPFVQVIKSWLLSSEVRIIFWWHFQGLFWLLDLLMGIHICVGIIDHGVVLNV